MHLINNISLVVTVDTQAINQNQNLDTVQRISRRNPPQKRDKIAKRVKLAHFVSAAPISPCSIKSQTHEQLRHPSKTE